ncbi:TPA: hypothetical protein F3X99_10325 [Aeromonas hydrophila]|nr:hypothetical protein [Aeromonas hydrophila]HAU4974874.1 hypothetical protein [Aeromonas hydrophila]
MTNKTFIRISKVVTADQAALVAAGINIAEVNGDVSEAKKRNVNGWHMAETIRNALLDNLRANHLDPELVSISYRWWDEEGGGGGYIKEISGLVNIIPYLQRHGAPHGASFKAASLWPWITEHVDLDPELYDVIASKYGLKHNAKTNSSGLDYLDPSHPRYSQKLAASVLAWEAMEDESLLRGVPPKRAITKWLQDNHKAIGLELSKNGIDEAATVANWNTTGGAPATPDE